MQNVWHHVRQFVLTPRCIKVSIWSTELHSGKQVEDKLRVVQCDFISVPSCVVSIKDQASYVRTFCLFSWTDTSMQALGSSVLPLNFASRKTFVPLQWCLLSELFFLHAHIYVIVAQVLPRCFTFSLFAVNTLYKWHKELSGKRIERSTQFRPEFTFLISAFAFCRLFPLMTQMLHIHVHVYSPTTSNTDLALQL